MHIGSQGELTRAEALENCRKNLKRVVETLDVGFDYRLCIETMGRFYAIGDYVEICGLCAVDARVKPTLDFGHINCLMQGGLREAGETEKIMDYCLEHLGREKMQNVHIHFSPIKFGSKGELAHMNFADAPEKFTPPFEPLAKYIREHDFTPVIICESSERMAQDAVLLKKMFEGDTK